MKNKNLILNFKGFTRKEKNLLVAKYKENCSISDLINFAKSLGLDLSQIRFYK